MLQPATRKRLILFALFPSLVLLCLWIALWSYLNSGALRSKVLVRVNQAIRGSLSIGAHHLAWHTGRLDVRDLEISDGHGKVLASVGQVEIHLFWPALLWREIRLSEVLIRKVTVDLAFDPSDRLLLGDALGAPAEPARKQAKPEQPFAWQVRVGRLKIEGANLSYAQPSAGRSGRADGIDILAGADLAAGKATARIQLARLRFTTPGEERRLNHLVLQLAYEGENARPFSAIMTAGQSRLSIQGRVSKQGDQVMLDGSADLSAELAEWAGWIPKTAALSGHLQAKAEASGPLDDPDVSLNLNLDHGTLKDFDLKHLEAGLDLHERRITVQRLTGRDQWGSLELSGAIDLRPVFARSLLQRTGSLDDLTYQFKLIGSGIVPEKMPFWHAPFSAVLQTDIELHGAGFSPRQARASAGIGITAEGLKTPSMDRPVKGLLQGRLDWQGQTLTVARAKASAGPLDLTMNGQVKTFAKELDLKGSLSTRQLAETGNLFGIELPSGQATLNLNAGGAWNQPQLKAILLGENLVLGRHPLGRLLAEATLDQKAMVHLQRLVLENQGGMVLGSARIDLKQPDGAWQADPGLSAELQFEKLQPVDFGLELPVQADLTGKMTLSGTLKNPRVLARLENSRLTWQSLGGRLDGNLSWGDGRMEADRVQWAGDAWQVGLQGSADWRDPVNRQWTATPVLGIAFTFKDLNLADARDGWSGTFNGNGRAAGPADDLKGAFDMEADKVVVSGQPFQHLLLAGRLAGATLYLDRLAAALAPDQTLEGKGWVSLDQRFQISLSSRSLDLRHIDPLQKAYPVDGQLALELEGRGSFAHPDIQLTAQVGQPRFEGRQLEDFTLRARLLERQLELEAKLNFDIKARADLASGDFDVQARLDQTDLTPYLALWAGAEWAGKTSGQVSLAGNWQDPAAIRGSLTLNNAALVYGQIDLAALDHLTLSLAGGRLQLPTARITLMQQGYLEVGASGPLAGPLAIQLDGRLPMAAVAPFIDAATGLKGVLLLSARARGAPSAWQWQADLSMDQVGFTLSQLNQSVSGLQGRVHLDPDQVSIDKLTCAVDSGRLSLNGNLSWVDFKPTRGSLILEAQALPLQWPGRMDAVVGGRLNLSGRQDKALLQGDLVLLEGTYFKDVRLNLFSAFTETRRPDIGPVSSQPPRWMENIALDVKLTHRNPFLVDNNVARLQIAPDLTAGGTLARPVLSGRAEVIEGEVIYRRKFFTVKRGVVDFINPYKTEPVLDIVSEARIRKWLVTLTVSGTPDKLAVGLKSDPPESDNDILSLILLGRTNKELTQGEGGGRRTTEQMLAALVSTAWGEDIKRTTGVDILEVETGSQQDETESDRIQVTVGKQLSRRLTVKYELETGESEMVQRAVSEYRFLENLLASGFQDSQGQYGAELLFRMEF